MLRHLPEDGLEHRAPDGRSEDLLQTTVRRPAHRSCEPVSQLRRRPGQPLPEHDLHLPEIGSFEGYDSVNITVL